MHPISILEVSIIKTLKESETFALSFFRALILSKYQECATKCARIAWWFSCLFNYVYWKCVWIGIVFSLKEKLHDKEPYFHTKREAWVCSGHYFISIIHVCILLEGHSNYITEPCMYKFSWILLSEWCLARNSSDHNVEWASSISWLTPPPQSLIRRHRFPLTHPP